MTLIVHICHLLHHLQHHRGVCLAWHPHHWPGWTFDPVDPRRHR